MCWQIFFRRADSLHMFYLCNKTEKKKLFTKCWSDMMCEREQRKDEIGRDKYARGLSSIVRMRCSNVCKPKRSRMVIARFCWVCREQRELRFDGYDDDMTRVRQSFSRLFIVFTCMLPLVLILTYRKTTYFNGQRRSMSKREAHEQRKREENIVSFRFKDNRVEWPE